MAADKIVLDVFGDESARASFVTYGAIAVEPASVAAVEGAIAEVKVGFKGSADAELHCREMFAGDARRKTQWAHLGKGDVFELYEQVACALLKIPNRRLMVSANRSMFPKVVPSEGDWPEIKLDEKQLTAFCANAVMIPFSKNPGLDRVRFWADPDRTKIDWMGKRRKQINVLSAFIENAGRVSPEPIVGKKPALLQVADFLAFTSARVLAGTTADRDSFVRLAELLKPEHVEFTRVADGGFAVRVPNVSLGGGP